MNYWKEILSQTFEDIGITATEEQLNQFIEAVEFAHDNYNMAHGYDRISNPLEEENKQLKDDLKTEKAKVICVICNGTGRNITKGPCHSSSIQCWKCRGEGKVNP